MTDENIPVYFLIEAETLESGIETVIKHWEDHKSRRSILSDYDKDCIMFWGFLKENIDKLYLDKTNLNRNYIVMPYSLAFEIVLKTSTSKITENPKDKKLFLT